MEALGSIQILLVPVGGFYTIDAKQAAAVVDAMNPLIVIPMHYKTPKVDFPIAPVDPFLAMQKDVEKKKVRARGDAGTLPGSADDCAHRCADPGGIRQPAELSRGSP